MDNNILVVIASVFAIGCVVCGMAIGTIIASKEINRLNGMLTEARKQRDIVIGLLERSLNREMDGYNGKKSQ